MDTRNQASPTFSSQRFSKASRPGPRLPKASKAVIDAPSLRPKANAKEAKGATAGVSGGRCVVCGDKGLGKITVGPLAVSICEGCGAMAQGFLKLAIKAVRK